MELVTAKHPLYLYGLPNMRGKKVSRLAESVQPVHIWYVNIAVKPILLTILLTENGGINDEQTES